MSENLRNICAYCHYPVEAGHAEECVLFKSELDGSKSHTESISNTVSEKIRKQVPFEELAKCIESLKIEDHEQLEFDGKTYQLTFTEEERGQPIELWSDSSGGDFVVWQSVIDKGADFFRTMLIEQLAKAAVQHKFASSTALMTRTGRGWFDTFSRVEASDYERKFKSQSMSSDRQKEYDDFVKELEQIQDEQDRESFEM